MLNPIISLKKILRATKRQVVRATPCNTPKPVKTKSPSFRGAIYLCLLGLIFAPTFFSARAQESTVIGEACSKIGSSRADWDAMIQCTATGWQYAQMITATPTANTHAATKAYVDAAVSAAGGGGSWFSQTFTASGTWTKPATTTSVNILAVGGGGGGGGCTSTNGGGGGGGGAVIWAPNVPVTGNLSVTVGAAGTLGKGSGNGTPYNGGDGGSTIVGSVVANGGGGGTSTGVGGSGGSCRGGRGFVITSYMSNIYMAEDGQTCNGGGGGGGPNPVGASTAYGGKGGGMTNTMFSTGLPGYGLAGGSSSAGGGGGGGASYSGVGGAGTGSSGQSGTGYGSGGGGAGGNNTYNNGGAGAPGLAIIYWQE